MTIQEQNIVFVESQVMDDVPEGGGAATGKVIIDGAMNNVFEDISDLDRAMGRFNLRKIFLAVRTISTDLYGGVKSVITGLPEDAALGYTLFSTGDPFDTRDEAVDRVEAYLFKGSMWHGYLLENHIAGMQVISVVQQENTQLPPIGKTLVLVMNEGLPGEYQQYVRVIDVSVTLTEFDLGDGNKITRWVVTMSLSAPLAYDFPGHPPHSGTTSYTSRTRIRDTTVADAARYYGGQPLAVAAAPGDYTVQAASQFAQLVPAARTETPLVEQRFNPDALQVLDAGAREVEVSQQGHTLARPVTVENRRSNWIETLAPRPAPGALSVAYMAQGNWYQLTDDGSGSLHGTDPSIGAGTVNYTTGTVSITLGALPDAGSQIMYTWASPAHYLPLAGSPDLAAEIAVDHDLGEAIKPGTLALSWLQGGVAKSATGAVSGQISGDATGFVSHVTGTFRLVFAAPPDAGTKLGIDYERQDEQFLRFEAPSVTDGLASLALGGAVEPGSVTVRWSTRSTASHTRGAVTDLTWRKSGAEWQRHITSLASPPGVFRPQFNHTATDDGAGRIVNDTTSLINYTTGAISLPVSPPVDVHYYSYMGHEWGATTTSHELHPTVVDVWFTPAGLASTPVSIEINLPPIRFRILPRLLDVTVVPGSVRFAWNGETYDDHNGDLLRSGNIVAGSINYLSGQVTLTDYVTGTGSITVTSLLARYGQWLAVEAVFRAAAVPLVPEALSIVAVAADGEQIIGVADQHGQIQGPYVRGTVNYEFGVCRVEFGELIDDPENPGTEIWQPRPVLPEATIYNAVAYRYIPVDASILGINPVRLPPDGRVPIYRSGDVAMVMHPAETAPTTPAYNAVTGRYEIALGRERIGWVRVIDAEGATVTEGYELDRAAGIVSWAVITGLATPVVVRHTVADLRLITDAQIGGAITLSRPLSHNYPAGESIVASCLLHGDRRARVSHAWDQASWNGTWVDYLVGNEAIASLDLIAHPIQVTNEGAETERWLLRWTGTTTVELIGQRRGLVYTGTYNADIAPINPRTRNPDGSGGVPYLVIPGAANGGGWSTGNVVRINTVGAIAPIWIARSIQQSDIPAGDGTDGMEMYALGNIDNPGGA